MPSTTILILCELEKWMYYENLSYLERNVGNTFKATNVFVEMIP